MQAPAAQSSMSGRPSAALTSAATAASATSIAAHATQRKLLAFDAAGAAKPHHQRSRRDHQGQQGDTQRELVDDQQGTTDTAEVQRVALGLVARGQRPLATATATSKATGAATVALAWPRSPVGHRSPRDQAGRFTGFDGGARQSLPVPKSPEQAHGELIGQLAALRRIYGGGPSF
jgi:hypothetical protein